MVDRVYLSLNEAASHLQANGLTGQTRNTLLVAIHTGLLAAMKDGRAWRTTLPEIERYTARLERLGKVKGKRHRRDMRRWLIDRDVVYESLPPEEKRRRWKAYVRGERPTSR